MKKYIPLLKNVLAIVGILTIAAIIACSIWPHEKRECKQNIEVAPIEVVDEYPMGTDSIQ